MGEKSKIKIRNISIERRLAYAFFSLSLVPILIVASLTISIAKGAIIGKSTNYIVQLISSVEDNLQNKLKNYEVLLNELMVNTTVQEAFKNYGSMNNLEMAEMRNKLNDVLISKLSSYPYIRDIKMINLEEEVIYQRGYLLNDESHITDIIGSIQRLGGSVQCFMQNIYDTNYIVLSKKINSVYNQQEAGYIVFILKEEAVRMVYRDFNLGEGANIYLVDQNDNIISSQYEEYKERFNEELLAAYRQAEEGDKGCVEYMEGHDKYTVVGNTSKEFGIDCIAAIPNAYFLKEINLMQLRVIKIVLLCFLLSYLVSKWICKSIIAPLKKLEAYIGSAMEKRFNSGYIDESPDELGRLGRSYVKINNEMYEMIQKIERDEKERRELEINMLQAQINPHFLFNTLNSLRWIAMMSRADSVGEGILALSDLLKNTIIQKDQYITLEEELQNVTNYILIQQLRYGDSFKLTLEVDDNLKKYKTLKFILQPIVENAIIHGIRTDESLLNIIISLEEEEGGILIEVKDDGKGFDITQMKSNDGKDIRLSGIGINNVIDRIRINFGSPYDVEIESELGVGTQVRLHIPKLQEV